MNRARDFLAGIEEKTAFRACVFAAILVLMAATMFLLNVHTPLQMDDYDYSFSWSTGKPLAGVADVLASLGRAQRGSHAGAALPLLGKGRFQHRQYGGVYAARA